MEENPLLPFTLAMTLGLTLVVLIRAAFSVWRHGPKSDDRRRH